MSRKRNDPVAGQLLSSMPAKAKGQIKKWAKKSRRAKVERKRKERRREEYR